MFSEFLILRACVYCCSCNNKVTTFLIPKNAKKVHAEREKPKVKSLDLGGSTLNKCEQSLIPYPFFSARILVASESAKEKFFPIPTEVGQVYSSVLLCIKFLINLSRQVTAGYPRIAVFISSPRPTNRKVRLLKP